MKIFSVLAFLVGMNLLPNDAEARLTLRRVGQYDLGSNVESPRRKVEPTLLQEEDNEA